MTLETVFIVTRAGMCPRVGRPTGDVAESLRAWQKENPGAVIYVLQGSMLPACLHIETADDFFMIEDCFNDDADGVLV